MTSRKNKTSKLRGHVSHGHGRVGKHRKHSGGRGKCGVTKHMRTWYDKYHPENKGKHGPRMMHYQKSRYYWPEIDINRIWKFIPKEQVKEFIENESIAPVIDVTLFGYAKVIGSQLPVSKPIVVKAKSFTKEAEEIIVKHGGQCMLVA